MRTCRALALGALLASGSACGWYHTHFPARDEVFKPIPLDVGERRVSGADTTYAVGGDGFELVAPERELLPDAKRTLDYAAREFARTFGVVPPPVVVEVRWLADSAGKKRARWTGWRARVDSAYRRPDGRRGIAVRIARPPANARDRERDLAYAPPLPLAQPVARAWLSGYADGAPPRPTTGSAPDASPDAAPAAEAGWTLADDPRLPDWLEEGVVALVAPSPREDLLEAAVARAVDSLPSLRALFAMRRPGRPAAPDERALPPDRRRAADARMRIGAAERFVGQSASVTRWLARQEGRAFVGRLVDRVLEGESVEHALGEARSLPAGLDALDRTWRDWLLLRDDVRMPGAGGRP